LEPRATPPHQVPKLMPLPSEAKARSSSFW
jgi:hypothetical protein